MSDPAPLDPETITKSFAPLAEMIAAPVDGKSPLWLAWRQLQVYATWTERLPTEEAHFTALMGKSPVGYDFFVPQQEANKTISTASSVFLRTTYNGIVNFANSMLSYAENVSPNDNKLLNMVMELLDAGNTADALTLLTDLQDMASTNRTRAGELQLELSEYRAKLSPALAKFEAAAASLEKDSKTNKETLAKLSGDENVEGSIAYLNKKVKDFRAEYDHFVVVAATSPTYVWVWPLGTIAAAAVATTFGIKATAKLKEIEKAMDDAAKSNLELNAANSARTIFSVSQEGLANAHRYTSQAIDNLGIVQDAWGSLIKQLEEIKIWAAKTTGDRADGGKDPKSMALLSIYLGRLAQEWGQMVPMLKDLTTELYANVEPGKTTLAELSKKIQQQAAA